MDTFIKRELKYHPILLKESKAHYDTDGQNNIIEFEQGATIEGGLGVCLYHIVKYHNRQKGQDELDDKKKQTFLDWQELLYDLLELGYPKDHILRDAMEAEYPQLKYSLKELK